MRFEVDREASITVNGSGAVGLAQQAFGELTRFQGRDGISLAVEEPGSSLAEDGGVPRGSGQLADLGEVQQPVALPVKLTASSLRTARIKFSKWPERFGDARHEVAAGPLRANPGQQMG
jgi:hypothetical protein